MELRSYENDDLICDEDRQNSQCWRHSPTTRSTLTPNSMRQEHFACKVEVNMWYISASILNRKM